MPSGGGISAKVGAFYEDRIAIWRLLELLDDEHDSVRARFEEPDLDGFEWWVQRSDGAKQYTQVKRQHALDREWQIARLASASGRSVLGDFGQRLLAEPDARCVFVSTLSASHLQELTESARLAATLPEFERLLRAAPKQESWDAVRAAWPGVSRARAWHYLRRIDVGVIDNASLDAALHAHARALIAGPATRTVPILRHFLSTHLCQELTAPQVWQKLKNEGIEPTDWYRNSNHLLTITEQTRLLRQRIDEERTALTRIERDCAESIADKLLDPDGPGIVTVIADAGMGKSALLAQVLDQIEQHTADPSGAAPVVLATRVDRLDHFHDGVGLGQQLRLPGSPASVLARVAAGTPALLVLDQIDAFGSGSGRNLAGLDAVTEVVSDARQLGVRVLLACRAFEAESDERISALVGLDRQDGRNATTRHVEQLGPLGWSEIHAALCAAGIGPDALPAGLLTMLGTPLHLHMLVSLHRRGRLDAAHITAPSHLLDQFYSAVCAEAATRQPGAPVEQATARLAALLSERQLLTVPDAAMSGYRSCLPAMISAGWLRRADGRIGFAHEAFFDSSYAHHHLASGTQLLDVLRSGEQHLFRRTQVRQILMLEREQDRPQYLDDVRTLLAAADVRPHIKQLVIMLVTRMPDPALDEWQALGALGPVPGHALAEHAYASAAQHAPFASLLLNTGIIRGYLDEPTTAAIGLWLSKLMVREHPAAIAALWMPRVGQAPWAEGLADLLSVAPLPRSQSLVGLYEAYVTSGQADAYIAAGRDILSECYGLHGLRARGGIRLIAAWARRRIALGEPVNAGVSPDPDSALTEMLRQQRSVLGQSMSAHDVLASVAQDDPASFVELLLPVLREAVRTWRSGIVVESGETDHAFATHAWFNEGHDPDRMLFSALQRSVCELAHRGHDQALHAIRDLAASPMASEQALAAAGFAADNPALAEDALLWLESGPHSLAQGSYDDHRSLSASVLAAVCARLPTKRTATAQNRAAAYRSAPERKQPDRPNFAARRLVRDIPPDRMTDSVRALSTENDDDPAGGPGHESPLADGQPFGDLDLRPVQSPLTAAAIGQMDDDDLIMALQILGGAQTRYLPDNTVFGGAEYVAEALTKAATTHGERFTHLLERLPPTVDPAYQRAIINGLATCTSLSHDLARTALRTVLPRLQQYLDEIARLLNQAAKDS